MVTTEQVLATPRVDAIRDIVEVWSTIAKENAALFREQATVDAERGDYDAALYAYSAAEFCDCARAYFAALGVQCGAIVGFACAD